MACYVYGIVPAQTTAPQHCVGVGDPGDEVSLVRHGSIAALISGVAVDRPLGGRDDLLRHSRLLDRMVMDAPVLPMRFGAVLADADAVVAELLAPHHDEFAEALAALAGTAQFTVKVRYVEEAVLREVIAEEPRIAQLSAASRDRSAKGGYRGQLRLGELVASAVDRKRADDTAILTDALAPHAVAVVPQQALEPDSMANLAALVKRGQWRSFEQAVDDLAERWADRVRLRLLGPIAPYDFTDLVHRKA
jgi:hypothetical protein